MSYKEEMEEFLKKYPYKEISIGKATYRYVLSGEEDKPCVIFLNGGMNCSEMWFRYVEEMSGKYRTLIFDYPLELKTCNENLEGIKELLLILGIKEAFLAGASFGGLMAQMFARQYPQMVTGMGLFSTAGLDERMIKTSRRKYMAMPILMLYMKHCNYEKLKRKLTDTSIKKYAFQEKAEDQEYLRQMFNYMFDGYTREKDIHITGMMPDAFKIKPCTKDDFSSIKDRVILVFPEKDFFTPAEQGSLKNLFPDAKVEYVRNGHMGTVLEYKKYIELIEECITEGTTIC